MDTIKVKIDKHEYNLLWLKTEEEKEKGLQGVTSLAENEGAFFDYRDDPQDFIWFWMKDTKIPLDIIFVGEDDKVSVVYEGEPDSEEPLEAENVYYVIELNKNSDVYEDDEVEILEDKEFTDLPKNELCILNGDGSLQFTLNGGERIFSRISTKVIIRKAKKAKHSKSDVDYKALGRYVFGELTRQENRDPQYVDHP